VICPDCKRPVSTHELFKGGRCPVVVFRPLPLPIRACPPRELGQR
jgi:hypothetical protein